jgi:hypothetical protein
MYWWYDHTISPPPAGAMGGTFVGNQITVTNLLDGNTVSFAGTIIMNERDGIAHSFSATDNTSGATLVASRARWTVDMPPDLNVVQFIDYRLNGGTQKHPIQDGPYSTCMFFPDDSYAVFASNDANGNMLLNQICALTVSGAETANFSFDLATAAGQFVAGSYKFSFPIPSADPSGFGGNVVDPLDRIPEGDDDGWMATSKPGT